jgi:hypothetical protein
VELLLVTLDQEGQHQKAKSDHLARLAMRYQRSNVSTASTWSFPKETSIFREITYIEISIRPFDPTGFGESTLVVLTKALDGFQGGGSKSIHSIEDFYRQDAKFAESSQ